MPSFDPKLALLCAKLCRACYCYQFGTMAQEAAALGFDVTEFRLGPIAGFVTKPDRAGAVYVVLPGTADIFGWAQDVCAFRDEDEFYPGQIHEGFGLSADAAYSPVVASIQDHAGPLLVCGHSYGAAVARLLAWRLAKTGHVPAAVYLFGEPRTGNAEWAREAAKLPAFSIVNHGDPIPHLPPRCLGFATIPAPLMIGEDGKICDHTTPWGVCQDFAGLLMEQIAHREFILRALAGRHLLRGSTGYTPALERLAIAS